MGIDELIGEVRMHYEGRGFSSAAIDRLLSEILQGVVNNRLMRIADLDLRSPIDVAILTREFQKVRSQTPREVSASVIGVAFCFAFGYRLKRRSVTALGDEARLPGRNNRALAEIAARLKQETNVELYAQFEIADALDDYASAEADYASPPKDMGTNEAIEWFKQYARRQNKNIETVYVVAHHHQMQRCLLLLNDIHNIVGVPTSTRYAEYDPRERQPRVISEVAYILSDAVSTAVHLAGREAT